MNYASVEEEFDDIIGSLSEEEFIKLAIEYVGYKPISEESFERAFNEMKDFISEEEKREILNQLG